MNKKIFTFYIFLCFCILFSNNIVDWINFFYPIGGNYADVSPYSNLLTPEEDNFDNDTGSKTNTTEKPVIEKKNNTFIVRPSDVIYYMFVGALLTATVYIIFFHNPGGTPSEGVIPPAPNNNLSDNVGMIGGIFSSVEKVIGGIVAKCSTYNSIPPCPLDDYYSSMLKEITWRDGVCKYKEEGTCALHTIPAIAYAVKYRDFNADRDWIRKEDMERAQKEK